MNIDSIKNGYVIDHIKPGLAMDLYRFLNLETVDCPIAIIKNAASAKMGRKDIIKIDGELGIDLNVLGYIDPDITINIVEGGHIVTKYHPELPERITNIIRCKNPRCISTVEQELPHVFTLTDKTNRVYRCLYCETKASELF